MDTYYAGSKHLFARCTKPEYLELSPYVCLVTVFATYLAVAVWLHLTPL